MGGALVLLFAEESKVAQNKTAAFKARVIRVLKCIIAELGLAGGQAERDRPANEGANRFSIFHSGAEAPFARCFESWFFEFGPGGRYDAGGFDAAFFIDDKEDDDRALNFRFAQFGGIDRRGLSDQFRTFFEITDIECILLDALDGGESADFAEAGESAAGANGD